MPAPADEFVGNDEIIDVCYRIYSGFESFSQNNHNQTNS
jgi:hypothetical protein